MTPTPTPTTSPIPPTPTGSKSPRALARVIGQRSTLAGGVILLSALWAFWPLGPLDLAPPTPTTAETPRSDGDTRLALDTAAFRAPLWVSPPAPPAPIPKPEPAPPPPPLRLQLLAIMGSGEVAGVGGLGGVGGGLTAVLYDPDSDRVLMRKVGDSAAGATIERITAGEIDLRDKAGTRTLALKPAGVSGGSKP